MRLRKYINPMAGITITVFVGSTLLVWNSSVIEIQSICSQIQAGHSLAQVQGLVLASSYGRISDPASNGGNTVSLIDSPKSMGRSVCLVELQDNLVVATDYNYSD